MSRVITLPPDHPLLADGSKIGGWWRDLEDGRLLCELCPRACHLHPGDRGFCFVRENRAGEMVLTTYGRSTGFCIDPIEKKPLNHFYPGTSVLSFGTAGCNLGCKFCQNWDISKSREIEKLSELAMPDAIAAAAQKWNCRSVAFTYNDPVIWAEYAIDVARACRAAGVKTVAVTAGYITPQARGPFYEWMDAANVDLKGFTEEFYFKYTLSHLQPVLDTLEWLKRETNVWFEITNLIIPQANDAADEIRQMCDWILKHVGDDTPVHFTAFHPDFRLRDRPNTPKETLIMAHEIACAAGLKYVYIGNVNDWDRQSTYCHNCRKLLIARNWYELGTYNIEAGCCRFCSTPIAGRFESQPGNWGRQRMPVQIADFAGAAPVSTVALTVSPELTNTKREPNMSRHTGEPPRSEPLNDNLAMHPQLTDAQQQQIHRAACEIVAAELLGRNAEVPAARLKDLMTGTSLALEGVFVTLKRGEHLRGCCGVLGPALQLDTALRQSACRTASQDLRLPPIGITELAHLDLDVTLLHGFKRLAGGAHERLANIEIGKHGLQIRAGEHSGLLLPHVAVEHGLDALHFLRQVCRKAGLPLESWKDPHVELTTFQGLLIEGSFDAETASALPARVSPRIAHNELQHLNEFARQNVAANFTGATPNYYLPGVTDRTVCGVALGIQLPDGNQYRFGQMSLRPGVPLQATLFQLTASAATALQSKRFPAQQLGRLTACVAVLEEPAMHGTAAAADLRGFQAADRALLVLEHQKSTWVYAADSAAQQVLDEVLELAAVTDPATAQLYSLGISTTERHWHLGNAPRAQAHTAARPAAVAGSFYPDDPQELSSLIDSLVPAYDQQPAAWPAAMVPHAGLKYSGQVAASVLQRVAVPQDVIILCPKHTRLGVDWAVAPHDQWAIPGATIRGNMALAQRLASEIPGLRLDAAAHQQEHAVEVELPLLARFAPQSRVVGIAIGACSLEQALQLGDRLAAVVATLEQRPLLLISSDMNHFGTDEENRRLDQLALDAMARLDPAYLYDTVASNRITMCGVVPAVIVMQALKKLGGLHTFQQIAYATSGDVSGDRSRVVGYAGVLLA